MPSNKEIINRNLSLLKDKGYFEGQKMSNNNPTRFCLFLDKALNIFRENTNTLHGPIEFGIPLTNLINNNQHALYLDLTFEYHPELQDALIKSIHAFIGQNTRTYEISSIPEDIPKAANIYNVLLDDLLNKPAIQSKNSRQSESTRLSEDNIKAINAICQKERDLLVEKGFLFTPFPQELHADNFTNALKEKLAVIVNQPSSASSFIGLRTAKYFKNNTSKTVFRLIYAVNPNPLKIHLKAVHGKMDKSNYFKIISDSKDLPVAEYINQTMSSRQLFNNVKNKFRKIFKPKKVKH